MCASDGTGTTAWGRGTPESTMLGPPPLKTVAKADMGPLVWCLQASRHRHLLRQSSPPSVSSCLSI